MFSIHFAPSRMAKAKTDFTDYIQAFEDELASFIKRVEDRAKARIEKAMAEAEEVQTYFTYNGFVSY